MNSVNKFYTLYRRITNEGWQEENINFVNRIYYVNSGSAVIEYENITRTLTAGNIYIMPQSDLFQRISAENFDHTYFVYTSNYTLRADSFVELPGSFCGLDKLFEFANQLIEKNNRHNEICIPLLNTILATIEKNHELPYVKENKITRALEIIRSDIASASVSEISKKLFLTEGYFTHIFSKAIGISPMKYIRLMRLSEAETLLKKGMSVSEVSKKCGYANPTAFWKAIKREYGCTPSELKNR